MRIGAFVAYVDNKNSDQLLLIFLIKREKKNLSCYRYADWPVSSLFISLSDALLFLIHLNVKLIHFYITVQNCVFQFCYNSTKGDFQKQ